MCRASGPDGRFDPSLCPLLQGLSDEERAIAMRDNPLIAACAATGRLDAAFQGPRRRRAGSRTCAVAPDRETPTAI
jgi:hypothetical protein